MELLSMVADEMQSMDYSEQHLAVEVAGIKIQPVECHHWSQILMPDGTYASGVPMGFVVYAEQGD